MISQDKSIECLTLEINILVFQTWWKTGKNKKNHECLNPQSKLWDLFDFFSDEKKKIEGNTKLKAGWSWIRVTKSKKTGKLEKLIQQEIEKMAGNSSDGPPSNIMVYYA